MALTSPSLCATHERSSGPSLTGGCVVRAAQAVLRPHPTPSRHALHFPASPVRERAAPTAFRSTPGPGRASPVPAATFSAFHAPYAGRSFGGCASTLFTPSMALAVLTAARLLLSPPAGGTVTTRQASRDAADRRVASPKGLRRRASTPPVSRPSRQPATEPLGSYSDGTHTRRRRRPHVRSAHSISTSNAGARQGQSKEGLVDGAGLSG
jgi:hypothetical protein